MDRWIKDGKFYDGYIELNNQMISNPTEEMLTEAGYTKYVAPEKTIDDYKRDLLYKIYQYDGSPDVNSFTVNDKQAWLNNQERTSYTASVNNAKLLGEKSVDLILNGNVITLPLDNAEKMLALISRYADKCYIVTQKHIAEVNKLTTKDDIEAYDYKAGYPDKLAFTL